MVAPTTSPTAKPTTHVPSHLPTFTPTENEYEGFFWDCTEPHETWAILALTAGLIVFVLMVYIVYVLMYKQISWMKDCTHFIIILLSVTLYAVDLSLALMIRRPGPEGQPCGTYPLPNLISGHRGATIALCAVIFGTIGAVIDVAAFSAVYMPKYCKNRKAKSDEAEGVYPEGE